MSRKGYCGIQGSSLLASLFFLWCGIESTARCSPSASLSLAQQLSEQKEHLSAALEYRRLAMQEDSDTKAAVFFWMAAYEYGAGRRLEQSLRMIGKAESASAELENEVYLLRGELHSAHRQFREASFYWENLASTGRPEPFRRFAARKGASSAVALGRFEQAKQLLRLDPAPPAHALEAIERYEKGQDKNPLLGGLLGLIPGLGYAYSGEYANALRSFILNGLSLWGIAEFAEREQWAGVALVGFAELMFYSGSVYGGTDAAVRYNERRLRRAQRAIEGNSRFEPELPALPLLKLRLEF